MLHVITEVGKPGRVERERRHFVTLHNGETSQDEKPRARRYIPHGYGGDEDFKPHPHFIKPKYTECGLDWKSRIRPIPSPHNDENKPEIWPEPWKYIRAFPWKSLRSETEWRLYPEGPDSTLRSRWGGMHKATQPSNTEIDHTTLYGKNRKVVDKRNGICTAAPGDKSYQAVEYSPDFHKYGSTLPLVNFGGKQLTAETFVPLQPLPSIPSESYTEKERARQQIHEMKEVQQLERWRPATPLQSNVPPAQVPIPEHERCASSNTGVPSTPAGK